MRRVIEQSDHGPFAGMLGFLFALSKAIGNREGKLNSALLVFYDNFVFPLSQLLDHVCFRMFGKNTVIYARKPAVTASRRLENSSAPAKTGL
jgi:hypothetical protein